MPRMMKDDTYYSALLAFARMQEGSYAGIGRILGVKGPAVQAWQRNGVAHRWRPALEQKYGLAYRKSVVLQKEENKPATEQA